MSPRTMVKSLIAALVLLAGTATAEPVVERTARNSIFAEGLGAGLFYSVNYERMLIDDLGVRLGFGYIGLSASGMTADGSTAGLTVHYFMFPLSVSYLGIGSGSHSLELGAGANLAYVTGSTSMMGMSASGSGVGGFGHFLVGYRYQPLDGGFQFRVGFDGMFGPGLGLSATDPDQWGFLPWFYISFGASFGNYGTTAGTYTPVTAHAGQEDNQEIQADAQEPPAPPAPAPKTADATTTGQEEAISGESLPFPEPGAGERPMALIVLPRQLDPRGRPAVNARTDTDSMVDRLGMPSKMLTQGNNVVFLYHQPAHLEGIGKARFTFNDSRRLEKAELWPEGDINSRDVIQAFGEGYQRRKSTPGYQVLVWPRLGLYVFVQKGTGAVKAIRLNYS